MNRIPIALACLTVFATAGPATAVVMQTPYEINGGGQYQYKPSPEGPGIPGGAPSNYQLDFGIAGTFTYELDTAGLTARLLNLNLVLTGNEAIQAAPPLFGPVTSDRVETYLASHVFVTDFIGGLLHLKSSTVEGLKLTDTISGGIAISGGYDHTPADGDAIHFQFTASPIPEPTTACLSVAAALALMRWRRR